MNGYRQQLTLTAPPDAVYAALTTPAGLRGWWTTDCDVDTTVGGRLQFRFGASRKTMRIERLDPAREVVWLCTDAHIALDSLPRKDEWVGTRLVFRLAPQAGGTQLDFTHEGLLPALACYDLCRDGWQQFLGSLQQLLETGRGNPWAPVGNCGAGAANAAAAAATSTDRIERSIVIDAPRERVWKALTTAETFGTWFGADLQGETFAVGKRTRGRIRMAGLEHVWFDVLVERMEAPSLFVWRWHPYAIDPETDYSTETPTQVSIRLDDAPGNATRVQVTESGFDALPRHRWSDAFRANNNGWDFQLDNLTRHVATQNRTPA